MKFDDKKYIAERIRFHRKKMNLTQSELAEMVDLSDQHLSRIERGCYIPSLTTFFQLVKILKIDLKEFGFNAEETQNSLKNKLINSIALATDAELIFYENMLNAVDVSLNKVKKEIL